MTGTLNARLAAAPSTHHQYVRLDELDHPQNRHGRLTGHRRAAIVPSAMVPFSVSRSGRLRACPRPAAERANVLLSLKSDNLVCLGVSRCLAAAANATEAAAPEPSCPRARPTASPHDPVQQPPGTTMCNRMLSAPNSSARIPT